MERIGETLRNARLAKNITIDDVVRETKIRSRYIEALEAEEWNVFPGIVYLKGFLRSYCSLLGLDDKPLLQVLNQVVQPEPEAPPMPQKLELPGRPRRKLGLIFGLIAIILLVAFQYIYANFINQPIPAVKEQPAVQAPVPTPQAPAPDPTPSPAVPETTTPPAPVEEPKITSIAVRLVGVDGKCWVRIKDAEKKIVYEGTMSKGEEKVFTDLPAVEMIFGNSGGIKYYLNDQDYGIPGKVGQRVTKIYTIENNAVTEKVPE